MDIWVSVAPLFSTMGFSILIYTTSIYWNGYHVTLQWNFNPLLTYYVFPKKHDIWICAWCFSSTFWDRLFTLSRTKARPYICNTPQSGYRVVGNRYIVNVNFVPILSVRDDVTKWKHLPRYWPFARDLRHHRAHYDVTVMATTIGHYDLTMPVPHARMSQYWPSLETAKESVVVSSWVKA